MSGKLLIFEFDQLLSALEVERAMAALGVEVVPVTRRDYNKPLKALAHARGDAGDKHTGASDYTGGPLGGRMMVLCDLKEQLDPVLAALRGAGVGPDCLKAVLTKYNAEWNAVKLYSELQREQIAFRGK